MRATARPVPDPWTRRSGLVVAAGIVLVSVAVPAPAQAVSPCTPTSGWDTCVVYDYTGADQVYEVPAGVTTIQVAVWGAAGAGGGDAAAGGGFSVGTLAVTPGEDFTVVVGQGGVRTSTVDTYGGGGAGGTGLRDAVPGPSWTIGGSGGGMSALFAGGYGVDAVLVAGGSGGVAPTRSIGSGGGGGAAGGVITDGENASGAGGGASAGGTAGDNGVCVTAAAAGAAFQGGDGAGGFDGGSGGGGGWFGGGGGDCQQNESGANNDGSGGGGSGYVDTLRVSASETVAATGPSSAGATRAHYVAGVGEGTSGPGPGGNGQVVIQTAEVTEAPPSPERVTSTGVQGAPQSVAISVPSGGLLRLLDGGARVTSLTVPGEGTYAVGADGASLTFTPVPGFVGVTSGVDYVVIDALLLEGVARYVPTVSGALDDPAMPVSSPAEPVVATPNYTG